MNNNGELITIKEAATLVNVNPNTLYRYIEKNRISCDFVFSKGKKIRKLKKTEILQVFSNERESQRISENPKENLRNSHEKTSINLEEPFKEILRESQENFKENLRNSHENLRLTLKEVVKETIAEERSQLMKPIEEQALYRLGSIEKENNFLRVKVETLLQEIEQYKALPWQIQERDEEIKSLESKLKEEKETLEARLIQKKEEELKQAEQKKEEALKELEAKIRVEAEEEQLRMKKQTEQEKEEILRVYEAKLQEAEAKQIEISEAWKKELELAKKPWWRFW